MSNDEEDGGSLVEGEAQDPYADVDEEDSEDYLPGPDTTMVVTLDESKTITLGDEFDVGDRVQVKVNHAWHEDINNFELDDADEDN